MKSKSKAKLKAKTKQKKKEKKYDIVDSTTGKIVDEMNYGDRVLRQESLDYLSGTLVVNPNEEFVKVFIKPLLRLSLMISNSEALFMTYLLSHLEYTSCVLKTHKGDSLTVDYIAKEVNLKERAVYSLIKRLCDHGIIAIVKTEGVKYFAMNPFIFHRGKRVSEEMVDIFKKSKWVEVFRDEDKVYKLTEEVVYELQ